MTPQTTHLQHALNAFTAKYLRGLGLVSVDGDMGPATKGRIRTCKYMLGYKQPLSVKVDAEFRNRLAHPRDRSFSPGPMLRLARRRRITGRARWAQNRVRAAVTTGVTTFDGRPVAAWIKPYLLYARAHGWKGTLNSGYRSPAYSDSLCRRICGAPRCPGLCAGRSSNHSGQRKPAGAVDVSDYVTFGRLMRECSYSPRLQNALPRDRVHYSASGG